MLINFLEIYSLSMSPLTFKLASSANVHTSLFVCLMQVFQDVSNIIMQQCSFSSSTIVLIIPTWQPTFSLNWRTPHITWSPVVEWNCEWVDLFMRSVYGVPYINFIDTMPSFSPPNQTSAAVKGTLLFSCPVPNKDRSLIYAHTAAVVKPLKYSGPCTVYCDAIPIQTCSVWFRPSLHCVYLVYCADFGVAHFAEVFVLISLYGSMLLPSKACVFHMHGN